MTRPNGLNTKAQPVTIRDPYSPETQRQEAAELAAGTVAWDPPSERETEEIRRTIELQREAANRGVRLRGLGVRR